MSDGNPVVIQHCDSSIPLPLYLVHDGGGTIMHYYSLGDIDRTVYGIDTKSTWRKGIQTMAEGYCAAIKEMDPPKKILLGGWSLGGIIALEMAQIFSEDADLEVAGVVLIESVHPKLVKIHYAHVNRLDLTYDKAMPKDVRDRIYNNLDESIQAVQSYIVDPELDIPSTVLIRANTLMPSLEGLTIPDVLGWDDDGLDFVKHIYDVPGHHFSIFQKEHVSHLTSKLAEACTMLENGVWS